ncbi:MAG: hypothetical protein M3Y03_06340, partial [Verrucomicrobiota bacterium]|nr:hypothetical protein [Verrucomicrobiota bacterium]
MIHLRRATEDAVALGWTSAAWAHKIENSLVAMRLRAGDPARAPEALRLVPGQINRLEGLLSA